MFTLEEVNHRSSPVSQWIDFNPFWGALVSPLNMNWWKLNVIKISIYCTIMFQEN